MVISSRVHTSAVFVLQLLSSSSIVGGNVSGLCEFENDVWFTDWTSQVIRKIPKRASASKNDMKLFYKYRPTALQIVHPYRQPTCTCHKQGHLFYF